MATVTVNQADIESVKALLGELKDSYKSVMVTSINKTLTTANTQAAARIGNKVNLKSARIKEDLYIQKASYSDISGSLKAYDKNDNMIGLISYGANQTYSGVTVQVLKSNSRSLLKHAFISSVKGTQHVFWRENRPEGTGKWPEGKKTNVRWSNIQKQFKLPVERLIGPSVAHWFGYDDVFEPVAIQAQTVYLNNVQDKIEELLRRYG